MNIVPLLKQILLKMLLKENILNDSDIQFISNNEDFGEILEKIRNNVKEEEEKVQYLKLSKFLRKNSAYFSILDILIKNSGKSFSFFLNEVYQKINKEIKLRKQLVIEYDKKIKIPFLKSMEFLKNECQNINLINSNLTKQDMKTKILHYLQNAKLNIYLIKNQANKIMMVKKKNLEEKKKNIKKIGKIFFIFVI